MSEQATGSWKRRQTDEHHCRTHTVSLVGATPGDVWECSCGLRYRVGDSQMDGPYLPSTPIRTREQTEGDAVGVTG